MITPTTDKTVEQQGVSYTDDSNVRWHILQTTHRQAVYKEASPAIPGLPRHPRKSIAYEDLHIYL